MHCVKFPHDTTCQWWPAGPASICARCSTDYFPVPTRDEDLRVRLTLRESRRPGSLHRLLCRFDPEAAARIHAHDVPKLIRALEVCLLTRRPVTRLFEEGRSALEGYRTLKLGISPDRAALYERLDSRCASMFCGGLVEEVKRILAMGYPEQPEAIRIARL